MRAAILVAESTKRGVLQGESLRAVRGLQRVISLDSTHICHWAAPRPSRCGRTAPGDQAEPGRRGTRQARSRARRVGKIQAEAFSASASTKSGAIRAVGCVNGARWPFGVLRVRDRLPAARGELVADRDESLVDFEAKSTDLGRTAGPARQAVGELGEGGTFRDGSGRAAGSGLVRVEDEFGREQWVKPGSNDHQECVGRRRLPRCVVPIRSADRPSQVPALCCVVAPCALAQGLGSGARFHRLCVIRHTRCIVQRQRRRQGRHAAGAAAVR